MLLDGHKTIFLTYLVRIRVNFCWISVQLSDMYQKLLLTNISKSHQKILVTQYFLRSTEAIMHLEGCITVLLTYLVRIIVIFGWITAQLLEMYQKLLLTKISKSQQKFLVTQYFLRSTETSMLLEGYKTIFFTYLIRIKVLFSRISVQLSEMYKAAFNKNVKIATNISGNSVLFKKY